MLYLSNNKKYYTFANMKFSTTYLFFLFFIIACSTDFDINSNWQDTTVVYGLLNQNETTHYIKINKAFLGKGNAITMSQVEDSSSYFNNLEVKIEEYKNGVITNSYYLDTTTIYNKESGQFYYPKQVLYKFNATLYENGEYKLIIKNKLSGKLITSQTIMIHDFSITKPSSIQTANFTARNPIEVTWSSAKNGRRYQLNIRFHYKEINLSTNDTTNHYVDWLFAPIKSNDFEDEKEMETSYVGQGFYANLHYKIPYNLNVIRLSGKVDFIISVAGDDFSTYMEVSEPSTGIVQEKPSYTNINNGIGIFSCRYNKFRSINLSPYSIDSLRNGSYTYNLRFQ